MVEGGKHIEFDERIQRAIEETDLIRPPKQKLATFGVTDIYYYLLTKPVYSELDQSLEETVVREGRVIGSGKDGSSPSGPR